MTFDWAYFFSLFSLPSFWRASVTVIELSVLCWLISIVLGFAVACARQSRHKALQWVSSGYIWLFRSIPLLVMIVFIYNIPQRIPATSYVLGNAFVTGLIATVLVETAYMAEIHRSGLLSVAKGQYEAGHALGFKLWGTFGLVVIPQAIRISLPSLVNEFITIVKQTSLVSVISLPELLMTGQRLYTENFLVMETQAAVAAYYVMIVTAFSFVFHYVERRLDIAGRVPQTLSDAQVEQLRQQALPVTGPAPMSKVGAPKALLLRNIHKSYGQHHVLKGIDLSVSPGEVISIIGPSGSGKTSLIRTINALESIDQGEIVLFGEPYIEADDLAGLNVRRQGICKIGMVFQGFNLFPHYTLLQNIMLAPRYHGIGSHESRRAQALYLLDKVGLLAHAEKYPHQLSGGQQQRVAIARALALSPNIILFDEPTSALDPELVNDVLNVIAALAKEGITMLIVTHEMEFALNISDRVVLMENGVVQAEAPPLAIKTAVDDPKLQRVRQFTGLSR